MNTFDKGVKHAETSSILLARFFLFILAICSAYIVYKALLRDAFHGDDKLTSFIILWILTAYITLPRVHRLLTRVYLPDYFIGRVRTSDGLLSDPVNLTVVGTKNELIHSMESAGWTVADNWNIKNISKMVIAVLLRKNYMSAPVSSKFLFGRKPDIAFEQELNRSPAKRHHVRFWQAPKGWFLPGGFKVDWIGAATFDKHVGLSLFTFQIDHKIAENIDEERDYIIKTLQKSNSNIKTNVIKNYSAGYHTRNGGGDMIKTDGHLPIIYL